MGGAMATRALSQGSEVVAFDISPAACERLAAAGAVITTSSAEVARRAPVVSVVVKYDDEVIAATLNDRGVFAGAQAGTIVVIHSTVHLSTLEHVAQAGAARGVKVVDAAVTGGAEAASRGELAVMIGGDRGTESAVRDAVEPYASLVMHAGPLGAGMTAKLAVNLVGYVKMAAAYEGLALAKAAGVDVEELSRVIAHSERQSGLHEFFLAARARSLSVGDVLLEDIARRESPTSQKDLHAALELAKQIGVSVPLAAISHDDMPRVWGLPDDLGGPARGRASGPEAVEN